MKAFKTRKDAENWIAENVTPGCEASVILEDCAWGVCFLHVLLDGTESAVFERL